MTDREFQSVPLPMAGQRPSERRDAAENRDRILGATRRLLADKGPDGVTMDAVAEAAGVGKGTIFRRFGDRAGLAAALVDEEMRTLQDRVLHGPPPVGPGAPAAERLEAFVIELIRHYTENLPAATLAARTFDKGSGEPMGALVLHTRALLEEINPALDTQTVALMILGSVAPGVIYDGRQRGVENEALESGALALLRGITQ